MGGGILGIVLFTGGIALLVGQPGTETGPPMISLAAPVGASTKGFDVGTLSAPAGTPLALAFDNQDAGVQHDVYIATEDPAKNPAASVLLQSTPITGPGKVNYPVPSLTAGTYYFYCSIHPTTMNGTLTAAVGASPAAGGGGAVAVSAQNLAFSTKLIDLPDGLQSQITFDNLDPGTTHNIGIYSDQGFTQEVFRGEGIVGPASTTYSVGPLSAGTYHFRCDYHVTMTGEVRVGSGAVGASGSPTSGPSPPSTAGPGPPGATVTLVAKNTSFDLSSITLKGGKTSVVTLDNRDAAVPHTFSIYTDANVTQALFQGTPVTGVATKRYRVPALDPGTYYFQCDIHPKQMHGTVTVT
jgi:plastocyanin